MEELELQSPPKHGEALAGKPPALAGASSVPQLAGKTCADCAHALRRNPALYSRETRRCALMHGMGVLAYHHACPGFQSNHRRAKAKRAGAEQGVLL